MRTLAQLIVAFMPLVAFGNPVTDAAVALTEADLAAAPDPFTCFEPTKQFVSAQRALANLLDSNDARQDPMRVYYAIHANDIAAMRRFLNDSIELQSIEQLGEWLRMAARYGNPAMMEDLLQRGASIDANDGIDTPLSSASWYNALENAKWLLEHGADPNANADRAIVGAARCDNQPMIRLLKDWGAQVDPSVEAFVQEARRRHGT